MTSTPAVLPPTEYRVVLPPLPPGTVVTICFDAPAEAEPAAQPPAAVPVEAMLNRLADHARGSGQNVRDAYVALQELGYTPQVPRKGKNTYLLWFDPKTPRAATLYLNGASVTFGRRDVREVVASMPGARLREDDKVVFFNIETRDGLRMALDAARAVKK